LRKRWHVLTLLTVATPVLASAGMVGIAETREGSYSVVRGENETVVARAQTPVLLNTNDRVATKESEVRIRMINGSAVVVRRGEVSFPSADVIRVHSGEAVVSFPEGSETQVESGEYRFSPADGDRTTSSLVVAGDEKQEAVAARSLRGQFAVSDSTNSQVARIHSPSPPASSMLVATSTYGFIPSNLAETGTGDRPDLFFVAPRAIESQQTTTSTPMMVAAAPPAQPADNTTTPVRQPAAPPTESNPGTAGLLPPPINPSPTTRNLQPYDLTQPVSSFVTEPGDRPPRPRR
jgi:hypothetical protein